MHFIGICSVTINVNAFLKKEKFTFWVISCWSCKTGHNEVMQFILKLGSDVDHCNEEDGTVCTALTITCEHECGVIVLLARQVLTKFSDLSGSRCEYSGNDGWTALMLTSHI